MGHGDITPVRPPATALAALEAVSASFLPVPLQDGDRVALTGVQMARWEGLARLGADG